MPGTALVAAESVVAMEFKKHPRSQAAYSDQLLVRGIFVNPQKPHGISLQHLPLRVLADGVTRGFLGRVDYRVLMPQQKRHVLHPLVLHSESPQAPRCLPS